MSVVFVDDVDHDHGDYYYYYYYYYCALATLACSKRSDGGERCGIEKAMKSRGGLLLPRFYFFALPFTLHRSPLSERLEQAMATLARPSGPLVPGSKNTNLVKLLPFSCIAAQPILSHQGHTINPLNVKVLCEENNTVKRHLKDSIAIKQRKV